MPALAYDDSRNSDVIDFDLFRRSMYNPLFPGFSTVQRGNVVSGAGGFF